MNDINDINDFSNFDYHKFKTDVDNIKFKLNQIDKKKIENHFIKIKNIVNFFYYLGLSTLFLNYKYIFPWLFLCIGIFNKWAILGHHICHGGFDNIKNLNLSGKNMH